METSDKSVQIGENDWSVKMVAERSWDPAPHHCFCRWNLCLQKPRKSKIWIVLNDTHLPLNSIVTTMASFYIIDTLDKKKKKKMWLGRYFVYTVAQFCLSCLVSQNHSVYSSMHSFLAFRYLFWKPKFLLWAIFAGNSSKGATALLHANLWSSGEEYLSQGHLYLFNLSMWICLNTFFPLVHTCDDRNVFDKTLT